MDDEEDEDDVVATAGAVVDSSAPAAPAPEPSPSSPSPPPSVPSAALSHSAINVANPSFLIFFGCLHPHPSFVSSPHLLILLAMISFLMIPENFY